MTYTDTQHLLNYTNQLVNCSRFSYQSKVSPKRHMKRLGFSIKKSLIF